MTQQLETPVLIAGGGPVGMTLALSLAQYGVRSVLVERNPATTRHPKMDLTNGRCMELYRKLGLIEALRAVGVPLDNPFDIAWITSLNGHELYRFRYPSARQAAATIRAENDGHHASEAPMRVSQIVIEPVLKQAVDENPLVDVRFNTAFERIVAQDDSGVTAEIIDNATGTRHHVRCLYLAGCDGGGSRVRRELDIELEGQHEAAAAYMVHFRSPDKALFRQHGTAWHYQNGSGTIIAQDDDEIYTLQFWLAPGMDPATMKPAEILEGWVGRPFDYEILQANPWAAHLVVAERYVNGRVALAGDAAHQFIPTGGYGMNSGVADAMGLGWVLAALVQGWGGPALLPAYDHERRNTAYWHRAASRRHMGVRIQFTELYMEMGDVDGADAASAARRAEFSRRIQQLGNAENESWGVELGYRYDGSAIVAGEPDPPVIDPLTYRPNTWPGARLPHVFLADGQSIHDHLGLYFTLVAVDDVDASALEAAATALAVPFRVLRLKRPDLLPVYERPLVLVRPDHHVAWRGDSLPADCLSLLGKAVGRA